MAARGSISLLRVVEDDVERAAVAGDPRDRLADLVTRRQEQCGRVEVLRPRRRRALDLVDALHDAAAGAEDPHQQVEHDRQHEHEECDIGDPPEGHRGLLSATIAAFRPIPGSAPRMMSNWALIALTDGSSGRRCSASTISSAPPSVASPSAIASSRSFTAYRPAASTRTTMNPSTYVSVASSVDVMPAPPRSRR